jgi:hypothetical protein
MKSERPKRLRNSTDGEPIIYWGWPEACVYMVGWISVAVIFIAMAQCAQH